MDMLSLIALALGILCLLQWIPAKSAVSELNTTLSSIDATPSLSGANDISLTPCVASLKSPSHCERTGELETRAALVRLFNKPFDKIRPPFLVNPETNRRLELDCYNEELSIGVEYSGVQHFEFPNPFHRTLNEFHAQLRRDQYKAQQCQQRGVHLIVVPFTVRRADIQGFLQQELQKRGLIC